jgi:hypothetical protein
MYRYIGTLSVQELSRLTILDDAMLKVVTISERHEFCDVTCEDQAISRQTHLSK